MFYSPIKPMEPKSRPRPFDSDRHVFQVKWDGVRILSFINGREVRLQNRKLRDRTLQYPEMQSLSQQISGREVILDGEMIALKDGKPSFSRILRRDLAARGTKERVQEIPVVYMVFDLLYADGRDLTKLPWEERDGMLKKLLTPGGNVQITESISGRGIDFYRAVVEAGTGRRGGQRTLQPLSHRGKNLSLGKNQAAEGHELRGRGLYLGRRENQIPVNRGLPRGKLKIFGESRLRTGRKGLGGIDKGAPRPQARGISLSSSPQKAKKLVLGAASFNPEGGIYGVYLGRAA
jgi:hypothetical protein